MNDHLRAVLNDPAFRDRWRRVNLERMQACHARGLPFRYDDETPVIRAGPLALAEFGFLAAMHWLAFDLGWEDD